MSDIIESKSFSGSKSSKIKSHHNVGGLPKNTGTLKLVEPLKEFLKDEVRVLGKSLGLTDKIANKHLYFKKYKNLKFLAQGTLYPDIIESRSSLEAKLQK